jgi:hypothetical protein
MKFRNYCVIIMGNTIGATLEVEKISEGKINVFNPNGILIATFSSVMEPKELNDWFKLNKRTFFIFDLNPESSGFNIQKEEIHNGLFGFLESMDVDKKTLELLNVVKDSKNIKKPIKTNKQEITEETISKMTNREKEILFNKLLDNGTENLTDNDKKILPLLVK